MWWKIVSVLITFLFGSFYYAAFNKSSIYSRSSTQPSYSTKERTRATTLDAPHEIPAKLERAENATLIDKLGLCRIFWTFDVAEWTIKHTGYYREHPLCARLKRELINEKRVKRVVYTDGSIENHGCTSVTKRCSEAAHFDYKFNVRVNTPPCCRQKMREILRHVAHEARKDKYFIAFGSLMGWARNGSMIPYDYDNDVIVEERAFLSRSFRRALRRYGHVLVDRDQHRKLWVQYSRTNHLQIDIWPYYFNNISDGKTIVTIPHFDWIDQPEEAIFPLKNVTYDGIETFVPNDYKKLLRETYGVNWRTELDCKYVRDHKCVPLSA